MFFFFFIFLNPIMGLRKLQEAFVTGFQQSRYLSDFMMPSHDQMHKKSSRQESNDYLMWARNVQETDADLSKTSKPTCAEPIDAQNYAQNSYGIWQPIRKKMTYDITATQTKNSSSLHILM